MTPSNGAVEVDTPNAAISVFFSESLDSRSITASSFKVTDAGGIPVSGAIQYIELPVNFIRAIFTPDQPLARSTQYHVALTSAIRDLAGNPLPALNASFTTIADSPWRSMPITAGTPSGRAAHVAVWTGSEMIVYGGTDAGGGTNSGARYDPVTESWTAMVDGPAATTAIWTGIEMITWTGDNGGRYSPGGNNWVPVNPVGAPQNGFNYTVVWTGTEMIVWGGTSSSVDVNTGGRFATASGNWSATNAAPASGVPTPRHGHSAVWTGTEMIIWGGESFSPGGGPVTPRGDGARYNPLTDAWTPISNVGAPTPGRRPVAVWTGQEMIIRSDVDGARYNPATDTWSAIAEAPFSMPRVDFGPTAVWTGTEMLIWGEAPTISGDTALGGRYNPATNSWRAITRENNSDARTNHTAVWTGTEMIVWGGFMPTPPFGGPFPPLQTGGRYTP